MDTDALFAEMLAEADPAMVDWMIANRGTLMAQLAAAAPVEVDDAVRKRALAHLAETRAAPTASLTIFRMGLGRDSVAMLCLLVEQGLLVGGERVHPRDVDAVVFTDPGAEWSNTYALIPRVAAYCDRHGLRFIVQAKPGEEGPTGWRRWVETRALGSDDRAPWRAEGPAGETIESKAARGYYQARAPIMADYASRGAIVKYNDTSCTANHKIGPNRAMLSDLSLERFGLDNNEWSRGCEPIGVGSRKVTRKSGVTYVPTVVGGLVMRAESGRGADKVREIRWQLQPHRLLLGIAADETARLGDCGGPLYERTFYPLAEMGVSKDDEAPILQRHGFNDVKKSGCVMCKFQPIEWYWALSVEDPAKFDEVEAYEANALKTSPNLLLKPKGVEPSNGWEGDPRTGKERLKLPIRASVAYWYELNKHRHPTIEQVLAKAYKRCDRADGSIVRAAEPGAATAPKTNPHRNPRRPRTVREAFAADADRFMEILAADGHEAAFTE